MSSNIQNLPEPVIRNILKYVLPSNSQKLKPALPFLSLCQPWRNATIPLIFTRIYFRGSYGARAFNLNMYENKTYREHVKELEITFPDNGFLSYIIEPILGLLITDGVVYPEDFWKKMNADDNQMFNAKNPSNILELVKMTMDEFVLRFPNITHLKITVAENRPSTRFLANHLVRHYEHQLVLLKCHIGATLDIYQFPPTLEYLDYQCFELAFPALPKINTLQLKELKLRDVPMDFSWQQYCLSLKFPHLRNLVLEYYLEERDLIRKAYAIYRSFAISAPTYYEPIELPLLERLVVKGINKYPLCFIPRIVPQHLKQVIWKGDIEAFYDFNSLPIRRIDDLSICVYGDLFSHKEFYMATNRLFGMLETQRAVLDLMVGNFVMDFDLCHWKNLKGLCFNSMDLKGVVTMLQMMPELEEATIRTMQINGGADLVGLGESSLKRLKIHALVFDATYKEVARLLVEMLGELKAVKEAVVPLSILPILKERVGMAQKLHPHFRHIKLQPYRPKKR